MQTVSKVCLVLILAACVMQAELEEERMAHHMESKCARDVRAMALEQQQSLDLCVESLMVAGTNLCGAKEQIEVKTQSCIVLPVFHTQPLLFSAPWGLPMPHHTDPFMSLFPCCTHQPRFCG